jgi:hypothetical protein
MSVLVAGLFLPPPLAAQFRAGPRFSVPSRTGVAPGMARVGPVRVKFGRPVPPRGWRGGFAHATRDRPRGHGVVFGSFGGGYSGSTCLSDPYAAGAVFCRQAPQQQQQVSFGQPLLMPYFWPFSSLDYGEVEEVPSALPVENKALAAQVALLTDAVEQLRQDQALRAASSAPAVRPQPPPEEKPLPAVLVYRDGHRAEVENFAILGKTLWVFGKQTTRRIPLADLDLDATQKANDERGVDFLAATGS